MKLTNKIYNLLEGMSDLDYLIDTVNSTIKKVNPDDNWPKFKEVVLKELKRLKLDKKFDGHDIANILKDIGYEELIKFNCRNDTDILDEQKDNASIKSLKKIIDNSKGAIALTKLQINNKDLSDTRREEAKETLKAWQEKLKSQRDKLKELTINK